MSKRLSAVLEFGRRLAAEMQTWKDLIARRGIKVE
jgi:hypothetical protein